MNLKDLKNKLIAVLGYGQEGAATARYLMKHGINPVLFDQKPWGEWPADEQDKIKQLNLNFIFGPDAFKELAGFDAAFRSPGIPLTHHDLSLWPELTTTSQTKFFFDNCPAKIIGVTGTKGKGTTAALISEILKPLAKNYLTGNIGKQQPLDILDDLKKSDWVVYELSSFQLQDLKKSPHIGVVLMATSEHLDYHKDNQEYIEAKAAAVKYQKQGDAAIINRDYPASVNIGKQGSGQKLYFSVKSRSADCFVLSGKICFKGPAGDEPLVKTGELRLRGRHNWENVCAAALAGRAAGSPIEFIRQAALNFKGLEHRLEFAGERRGVKFYDDSFSTTPETAIAAIRSFDEPLIVILGGSKKNSDFAELGNAIKQSSNLKAAILIGQEAGRIKSAIGESKLAIFEGAKNMAEIFKQIKSIATPGDAVVLSPACASFDMFKNYKDRGEQFKASTLKF